MGRAHGYETRRLPGYISGPPHPAQPDYVSEPEPYLTESNFHFVKFAIPEDAGARVALARYLISLFDPSVELLMQLGDWSVWPSGQHMPLFERFREAFGERRPLIEVPGHVLSAAEREDALSILAVSVLFLWNCHVLSERGDEGLFVSHDEYGWFAVRDPKRLRELEEQLGDATD